jgi:2-keto-4-pentenoate hydratase
VRSDTCTYLQPALIAAKDFRQIEPTNYIKEIQMPPPNLTGIREAQLLEAANLLMDARRTGASIQQLPEPLRPVTLDESYFIQDQLAQSYGEIAGWKVGAPTPEATPIFAPMPEIWLAPAAAPSPRAQQRFHGVEAEVAFLLAADLPPRTTPYTHDEVYAAVASCHPAIELIESAFADPTDASLVDRFSQFADLQMHGGFAFGPACPDWQTIDFTRERVTLAIDGSVRLERTGSNTAGDLLRLLPWLANEGATRTGGLSAGQWITTGSWTGCTRAMGGSTADVQFSSLGRVTLHFE